MSMNLGSSSGSQEPEVMMDVNTTPLIDVMLVLLVMLIITIPIQLHSVNLDMPPPSTTPPLKDPIVHEVFIDFDGTVSWDGVALADQAAAEPDQSEVHIKPNKLAEYGSVATVMAAAQRLGVKKMGMVGNEQFVK